jgi:hypothetical protein
MAKDCIFKVPPKEPKQEFNNHKKGPSRIWIKKRDKVNVDECSLALQAQRRTSDWYVDSGCSKHIIGDKNRFITRKK